MSDAASAFELKTKYDQATWQVVEVLKKVETRYPDTLKFGRAFTREETGIAVI